MDRKFSETGLEQPSDENMAGVFLNIHSPEDDQDFKNSLQTEDEKSELVKLINGEDLSSHDLLDKKFFLNELHKIKQEFISGDIDREEYKRKKKRLYVERAIQRGVKVFSSAEQFLLEKPDISSRELAEKIKQYAQEQSLRLSELQMQMIDRASELLDKRRQRVVDLLDEVSKVLPANIDVPKSLAEWDEMIDKSLDLKLFVLHKLQVVFLGEARKEALKAIEESVDELFEKSRQAINDEDYELLETYQSKRKIVSQVEIALHKNQWQAFRLIQENAELIPSKVTEYFKDIEQNVNISFGGKPLVAEVKVFSESLWGDKKVVGVGAFSVFENNPHKYNGMTIQLFGNRSTEEIKITEGHEWSHFLETNFYEPIRKEYAKIYEEFVKSQKKEVSKENVITADDLWQYARDELKAYLNYNQKIYHGTVKPLLRKQILDIIENDLENNETLREAMMILERVHDRIILLLSLGYKPEDISRTVQAAVSVEGVYQALVRDYEIDVDNLSALKESYHFAFLRPDDLVLELKERKLLGKFCQSIPSAWVIKNMYDSSSERSRLALFTTLRTEYATLQKGSEEVQQEIENRYFLALATENVKYIHQHLEKVKDPLKTQLKIIYQKEVNKIQDFNQEVQAVQENFIKEWVNPLKEIRRMLPEDHAISLSLRELLLWKNFTSKEKQDVIELFVWREFKVGEGLSICVNAVDEYKREKSLNMTESDNLQMKLIKAETSDFLGRLASMVPEVMDWSPEKIKNVILAYLTLKAKLADVDHFTASAFIIEDNEILSEKNILKDIIDEYSFGDMDELRQYWIRNVSSLAFFKHMLLTGDDALLKNNLEISTETMARTLSTMHSFLKNVQYSDGRRIGGEDALRLTIEHKAEIVQCLLVPGKIIRIVNILKESRYNINTGEKLKGLAEFNRFLEELLRSDFRQA